MEVPCLQGVPSPYREFCASLVPTKACCAVAHDLQVSKQIRVVRNISIRGQYKRLYVLKLTDGLLSYNVTICDLSIEYWSCFFLVPVSSGRTVIKFHANSPDLLSFNMDQPVKIFSKGAGRDRELWGVEVSHE